MSFGSTNIIQRIKDLISKKTQNTHCTKCPERKDMSTTGLIALKINKVFPNLHKKISESKLQLNQQVPLEKLKAQTDKELGMT